MKLKIDHLNLTVKNLDESVRWYEEIFGFKVMESGITPQGVPWKIISSGDTHLALYEFESRESAETTPAGYHRLNHFGLRVQDRQEWEILVAAKRARVNLSHTWSYPHSASWYLHDPSGHEIEVNCTDDGGPLRF